MKIFSFLFLLIPFFLFSQTNFEYKKDFENILKESKNKNSDFNYEKLLPRFNTNDTTLTDKQMLSLLIGFTNNIHYKPYKDLEFRRNLYKLNDDKKFDEAIKEGNQFIINQPFDLKTLFELSYAHHKKGDQKLADAYLMKATMIFKAMIYSGDGKSIDSPMFALNPSDGQDFIRKAFGAKIGKMGSGRDKNGYFIDMLEMKDGEESQMMYFIIPHATKKMFE